MSNETLNWAAAITNAAIVHRLQTYGDRPYILHPLRVMSAVWEETKDVDLAIAAVLHDTVEDGKDLEDPPTVEQITRFFGERVGSAVDAVTRREGESYDDFILRAASHPDGRIIKWHDVADHLSNSATLPPGLAHRYGKALTKLERP